MPIHYSYKTDRFYDSDTGQFVDSITGMLSSIARRELKEAEALGSKEYWREQLREKFKREKVKPRQRIIPETPREHENLEMNGEVKGKDLGEWLDYIIYRNEEYMDEEVLY